MYLYPPAILAQESGAKNFCLQNTFFSALFIATSSSTAITKYNVLIRDTLLLIMRTKSRRGKKEKRGKRKRKKPACCRDNVANDVMAKMTSIMEQKAGGREGRGERAAAVSLLLLVRDGRGLCTYWKGLTGNRARRKKNHLLRLVPSSSSATPARRLGRTKGLRRGGKTPPRICHIRRCITGDSVQNRTLAT